MSSSGEIERFPRLFASSMQRFRSSFTCCWIMCSTRIVDSGVGSAVSPETNIICWISVRYLAFLSSAMVAVVFDDNELRGCVDLCMVGDGVEEIIC